MLPKNYITNSVLLRIFRSRIAPALKICYFNNFAFIFCCRIMPAINYQLPTVAMESPLVDEIVLLTMDACFTAFDKDG